MPFQVSPGVNVTEYDLTTIVPGVSTTEGAIAGIFRWGPVEKPILVDSEDKLVARYGKPTNLNAETFWTAANFLAYGNKLYVSRGADTDTLCEVREVFEDATLIGNVGAVYLSVTHGITHGQPYVLVRSQSGGITNLEVGDIIVSQYFPTGTKIKTIGAEYVGGVTPDNDAYVVEMDKNAIVPGGGGVWDTTFAFLPKENVFTAVANSDNLAISDEAYNTGNYGSETEYLNGYIIKNEDDYETKTFFEGSVHYAAKYPGYMGNSLKISQCDSQNAYEINAGFHTAFAASGGSAWTVNSATTPAADTATVTDETLLTIGLSTTVGSTQATFSVVSDGGWFSVSAGDADDGAQALVDKFLAQTFTEGDILYVGNNSIGFQSLVIESVDASVANENATTADVTATINFTTKYALAKDYTSSRNYDGTTTVGSGNFVRRWAHYDLVDAPPGVSDFSSSFGNGVQDEVHIVVEDADGAFSGVPGTVLEVWQGLSRATDAKGPDGEFIYYKDIINNNSAFAWNISDRAGAASADSLNIVASNNLSAMTLDFIGGHDGADETAHDLGAILAAADKFKDPEEIDVSLILTGKSRGGTNGTQVANYLIDNIAHFRKDCVVFVSPEKGDVVANAIGDEEQDCVDFRNSLSSSSYAVMDSGYKYQYDRYNDLYRWIPLNGDIAGLAVRTDNVRDPWWSPAGFNRGQIKNIIKLAWNPGKAQRDILYKNDINPVALFPGQGTVLFGDKTILGKPSAFDRINVRRLFIVLEKAIATAAKFTLFEFNDEFTRASFVNLVEPFLRDVQGRRGIYDFKVVCDETNNTGEVIDRNEFVGDIYIKPARSINFIQLNFVAVRTGVEFSEVVGRF